MSQGTKKSSSEETKPDYKGRLSNSTTQGRRTLHTHIDITQEESHSKGVHML